MRISAMVVALLALAAPAVAQQRGERIEFWRVREGAQVVLVLGTGGECRGVVSQRTDGALAVKVGNKSAACGKPGTVVNVREQDTRSVERGEPSSRKSTGKKIAAVGLAAGAGLLALAGPGKGALAAIAGGAEGVHLLNRSIDRGERSTNSYVLYVAKLA